MKRWYLSAVLLLCLAPMVVAQDTSTTQSSTDTTTTSKSDVQPKRVKITANTVKAAQAELQSRGYDPGPQDGVEGPQTRAAIEKFQADQGLSKTGRLDTDTLTKLNVGGTNVVSSAPADLGRGGKAFGRDMKERHPVQAGKALAKGSESLGKKVGKGTKALAVHGAEKVGSGLSKVGNKVEDKTRGTSGKTQSSQSNPPER